jgi:hypothetical protein
MAVSSRIQVALLLAVKTILFTFEIFAYWARFWEKYNPSKLDV